MYTVAGSTVTAVREDWYVAGRRVEPSDRLAARGSSKNILDVKRFTP
jgi:hypothetical protein